MGGMSFLTEKWSKVVKKLGKWPKTGFGRKIDLKKPFFGFFGFFGDFGDVEWLGY